jgi:flagellum-specific ATP synthase
MRRVIETIEVTQQVGRVIGVSGGAVHFRCAAGLIHVGDRAKVQSGKRSTSGEVIRLDAEHATLLLDGSAEGIAIDDRVTMSQAPNFAPDDHWIGRVIDPDGLPLDGRALLPGERSVNLYASPPLAHARRAMGARLETGLAVFNTMLPVVQGQRIGLFAGSGVGKSTLIADLARGVAADVVVIALVGERGREVRHFVDEVLGPEGMKRAIVVVATSDRAPQVRRRCSLAAMAVAETFRDKGQHVLLLVDSVTRFCEAHREVALAQGESADLRGFPASTAATVANLCERAGPGEAGTGDITAIFSVLVAGSDMEEPIADMMRGVLDGHVTLDREIAERGRFPAIDVVRSVSRSLPDAANAQENVIIAQARALLAAYARSELMIQSGLYETGSDPQIDTAISCHSALDSFMALKDTRGTLAHFAKLRQAMVTSPMQADLSPKSG